MVSSEVQRTLVKSPPELWAELSDPPSLARHLEQLGDIVITSTQPETTVEWEGEKVAGTVGIQASGWGTKVTLTAQETARAPSDPTSVSETVADIEPAAASEPAPADPRRGLFARLFRRRRKTTESGHADPPRVAVEAGDMSAELKAAEELPVEAVAAGETLAEQVAADELATGEIAGDGMTAEEITAVLTGVLDRLGAAHHRPFSRA